MKTMNYPSNLELILVWVVHIVLYITILFGTLWLFGARLDKNPLKIGEGGMRLIAFGFPFLGLVALIFNGNKLDHFFTDKFGSNAAGYICAWTIVLIFPVAYVWDKYGPRKITIPLGIIGYVISCLIIIWKAIH